MPIMANGFLLIIEVGDFDRGLSTSFEANMPTFEAVTYPSKWVASSLLDKATYVGLVNRW